MDSLKATGDNSLHSQKSGPFGSPVSRTSHSVIFPCEDDERSLIFLIILCRFKYSGDSFIRKSCKPSFFSSGQMVFKTDVGKGSSHHHIVISSPATITIKIV